MAGKQWTNDEIELLKELLPDCDSIEDIVNQFPDRTVKSIAKAGARFGINRNTTRWSDRDIAVLNRFFAIKTNEEIMEMLPSKTYNSITAKASKLGLKKSPELRSLMQQGDNNHFAGHSHSDQTRDKMKEVWNERKQDPNWQHCWTGKRHNKDTIKKLSEIAKNDPNWNRPCPSGFIMPEEWKEKMRKPHNMSPEGSQALRESIMNRPGGGYGNWEEYEKKDGSKVWLQSSYERRFAEACDKYGLEWERNTTQVGVVYQDCNGDDHMFYPDFTVIKNGVQYVVETKGEHLLLLDLDIESKVENAIDKFGERFILACDVELTRFENTGWF